MIHRFLITFPSDGQDWLSNKLACLSQSNPTLPGSLWDIIIPLPKENFLLLGRHQLSLIEGEVPSEHMFPKPTNRLRLVCEPSLTVLSPSRGNLSVQPGHERVRQDVRPVQRRRTGQRRGGRVLARLGGVQRVICLLLLLLGKALALILMVLVG